MPMIDSRTRDNQPVTRIARVLGVAIGRIRKTIAPISRPIARSKGNSRASAIGATEDQVNMTLQQAQRIDSRGTKAEDIAGTGAHDSQGG